MLSNLVNSEYNKQTNGTYAGLERDGAYAIGGAMIVSPTAVVRDSEGLITMLTGITGSVTQIANRINQGSYNLRDKTAFNSSLYLDTATIDGQQATNTTIQTLEALDDPNNELMLFLEDGRDNVCLLYTSPSQRDS